MELLAPWSLVGLVLVPAVFLWGILAPRGRHVVVGSLLLWKRALGDGPAGKPSARVRLADPLLWLDAVLVLLVVVALARPAVRTAAPLEPVATLVIDRTASMGASAGAEQDRRADGARAMMSDVLGALGGAPIRLVLVPDDSNAVLAERVTAYEFQRRFAGTCGFVLASRDALPVALAEAAGNPDLPILYVTDVAPQEALPANLYVFACGAESHNAGLVRVAGRIEGAKWWLLVSARATADTGARDLLVKGDGRPLAEVPRFLEPARSGERVLAMPGRPPARLRVALVGPADDFAADDAAYLVLEPGRDLDVLVTGEVDDSLRRALAAREGTVVLEAPDLSGAPPPETDLVVACASALPADWKGPAALVLPPEGAVPARRETDQEAPAEWRVAVDHPLADALYLEPPRLGPVRRYALDPSARVVLGTPDVPLIVTWEAESARRLAVLFGFDEAATDWPKRAGFPVFWCRAMEWLVPADRRVAEYRTYRPLEPMQRRTGHLASEEPGFFSDEVGEYGVSFIGSDEGFQAGAARNDSPAAVEAIRRSIEAKRRATLADLWPYLAAAAMAVLLVRTRVAK